MDTLDELTGSNDNHHSQIMIKGKRTKRRRPSSPFGMAVTSSSSTGGGGHGDGGDKDVYSSIPSPTTSGYFSTSTEEEEDMANCLILLAQGGGPKQVRENEVKIEKFTSQILTDMPPDTASTGGSDKAVRCYIYECRTCNRTFSSFQALGGHRASHKKPKAMVEEKKAPVPISSSNNDIEDFLFNTTNQVTNKGSNNNHNKPYKVHECSVCGSKFSSGQALGGHMRRHRTVTNTQIAMNSDTSSTIEESHHEDEKPKHFLPLDLNLPAPEDDYQRDSKFQFRPNQQHLIFSGPALVDCHY